MRIHWSLAAILIASLCLVGCGGTSGGDIGGGGGGGGGGGSVAPPTVATSNAQNGAVIVSLSTTTSSSVIYFTLDGSTPTPASPLYLAPFLVSSNLTLKAIAVSGGGSALTVSTVTSQSFTPNIPSGTLVWSDEFANSTGANAGPDATVWTYDTGTNCCGNNELETYCAWGSSTAPCSTTSPSEFVGTDGYLHIVGQNPSATVYTSARLKSQGHFSFMYGRIEARMMLPEQQGMWPAFWMLGNNIATINWPACGELDLMEHIDGNDPPPYQGAQPPGYDWIAGSVHGGTLSNEINGGQMYHPTGFSAAEWHTYGMIWTQGHVQYYVDDFVNNIYADFTPTNSNFNSTTWPFDQGPQFVILNLAIGGDWPGSPDNTTVFPQEMLVDYVRIYTN
jgi:beta-glucanase (GH16 family)